MMEKKELKIHLKKQKKKGVGMVRVHVTVVKNMNSVGENKLARADEIGACGCFYD